MARCKSIEYTIPSADSSRDGKMNWMILSQYLFAGYVDIRSRDLPQCVFESSYMQGTGVTPIKINYCFRGRCEVMLNKGATTFVVGDEFAVDHGTSCEGRKAFFYPTAEYEGVELVIIPAKALEKELLPFGGKELITGLADKFSDRSIPYIAVSNPRIRRCMEDFRDDIMAGADEKLLMTDVVRILFLLKDLPFEDEKRRTFCTPSQVDIAKKTVDIITRDLSKRYSAEELAAFFGVSESSLKNYCRVVFGKGYQDMIAEIRMKRAAELILQGDDSLGEIAEQVGYQSQSRFSKAFLKYHKVLPMEYKRRNYTAML